MSIHMHGNRFYLFPVHGLIWEDLEDIPQYLRFRDGAFVTNAQARSIMKHINKFLHQDLLEGIGSKFYIMIGTTESNDVDAHSYALHRAQEVMAGVAIPIFTASGFRYMPSLSMEIYRDSRSHHMYSFHRDGFSSLKIQHTNGEFRLLIPHPPIQMGGLFTSGFSKNDAHKSFIYTMLNSGNQSNLASLLRNSATVFYRSINTPVLGHQFLGSFTALEILVGHGAHEKIRSRCRLLLGDDYSKYFKTGNNRFKDILGIRNAMSHKGGICTTEDVGSIINVVIRLLYRYAHFLKYFDDKEIFCSYLDMINILKAKPKSITIKGLNVLQEWDSIYQEEIIPLDCIDLRLISYFDLHHMKGNQSSDADRDRISLATAVNDLSKLKSIPVESAYNRLCRWLWHKPPVLSTVDELILCLSEHRDTVEKYSTVDKDYISWEGFI